MKRLALLAFGLTLINVEVAASPPKEVIDQCMKASDFQGCVKVMTGQTDVEKETKITVDLDKIRSTGNMCPSTHAYTGAGYCQEVKCFRNPGGHDPRLGGKGWSCKGGLTMQFVGQAIRATTDERCPLEEPQIGKNNSCANSLSEKEINNGIKIVRQKSMTKNAYGLRFEYSEELKGMKVSDLISGCAAYKSGLRKGDVVKSIDGLTMPRSYESLQKLLEEMTSKNRINKFSILRFGEERTILIEPSMCTFPEIKLRYNSRTGEASLL